MSNLDPRRPGSVVWVDLSTTHLEAAVPFYESLFGWRCSRTEGPGGTYTIARTDAGDVCGLMAPTGIAGMEGMPSAWNVIIGVDDLPAALADARGLGGSVAQGPTPIPGGARVAAIADPAGAVLTLLEMPAAETGMAWGEPGTVCWVECLSRRPDLSRGFYEQLFGWKGEEGSGGYVVLTLDGERVGGLMSMPPNVPAEAPSHWLVYFAGEVATTCHRAVELGGQVLQPIYAIDEGRFAVLADPTGATFVVFEGTID